MIDLIRTSAYDCQASKPCDPDAEHVFQALRKAGVKLQFSPILMRLKCDHWLDAVVVTI
jgi:hypothetical protein